MIRIGSDDDEIDHFPYPPKACRHVVAEITVTGTPARESSQLVSRAPWPTGRVSSAKTRSTLPCSAAARTTPSAVPKEHGGEASRVAVRKDARARGDELPLRRRFARFTFSSFVRCEEFVEERVGHLARCAPPQQDFARDSMRAVARRDSPPSGAGKEISAAAAQAPPGSSPHLAFTRATRPRAPSFTAQSATAAARTDGRLRAPRASLWHLRRNASCCRRAKKRSHQVKPLVKIGELHLPVRIAPKAHAARGRRVRSIGCSIAASSYAICLKSRVFEQANVKSIRMHPILSLRRQYRRQLTHTEICSLTQRQRSS